MFCATAMLSSCEDIFEDSKAPDGSKPDIKILSPTSNRSFSTDQGLPLQVTVVDKDDIKELLVLVKGSQGELDFVRFSLQPNKKVLELDTVVAQNSFIPGTYTLEISAKDGRSNLATKEVVFKINN